MATDAFDTDKLANDISAKLAEQIEDTRALAEHYAHSIYPKAGQRLAEIKVSEGKCYLVLTSDGGVIDEYGSIYQHPNAPLRRAADATGLRFVPSPKP